MTFLHIHGYIAVLHKYNIVDEVGTITCFHVVCKKMSHVKGIGKNVYMCWQIWYEVGGVVMHLRSKTNLDTFDTNLDNISDCNFVSI